MSDPRDKTTLTASADNVPFGRSGSPSPMKIGATSKETVALPKQRVTKRDSADILLMRSNEI